MIGEEQIWTMTAHNKKGHIVFQHHQDEVWFRRSRFAPSLNPRSCQPIVVNTLNKAWREAGWVNLFNGKNTMRWRVSKKMLPQGWIIENDRLKHISKEVAETSSPRPSSANLIFSGRKVAPGANSGVKYFIMEERGGAIGHDIRSSTILHPDAPRGPMATAASTMSFRQTIGYSSPSAPSIKVASWSRDRRLSTGSTTAASITPWAVSVLEAVAEVN